MTQEQLAKLDKCYFNYSIDDQCVEEIVDARSLLGTHRFDFYGILFYIDQRVKGVSNLDFAKEVYRERTRAMTGFKLSEIGNDNKTSFDDFINVLNQLISDFQSGNYDYERTLIPIDKKGEPIDGAHRISCAAYFNKKIKILRFLNRDITPYDYEYLNQALMPSDIGEIMALESLKWHDDIYALFLWPKAHKNTNKLKEAIRLITKRADLLYQVEYELTFDAIKNLMIQLYGHMDWVGSIDDRYANIIGKVDEVWNKNGKLRIVLIRANNYDEVLMLKSQLRDFFGIGLASVHSTDNIRETNMAMNALLNPNSRHHLLNADTTRYKDSFKLFLNFKEMLDANDFEKNEFLLDSGMVLSMYGMRETRDLDYYCLHNAPNKSYPFDANIEEHDETQQGFYSIPIRDLIYNPQNHFVFYGIKFVSLHNLLQFKRNRYKTYHNAKDIEDIKLIQSAINENSYRKYIIRSHLILKRKYRLFKQSARITLTSISKKLHIYKPIRALKKKLFR